mmetsp:Transcript_18759/g.46946  ORF Transcript_18759/g.46946 Transcript_18759/m.46946 type:complete len:221 (-) Transcript_18759:700-1362(-)
MVSRWTRAGKAPYASCSRRQPNTGMIPLASQLPSPNPHERLHTLSLAFTPSPSRCACWRAARPCWRPPPPPPPRAPAPRGLRSPSPAPRPAAAPRGRSRTAGRPCPSRRSARPFDTSRTSAPCPAAPSAAPRLPSPPSSRLPSPPSPRPLPWPAACWLAAAARSACRRQCSSRASVPSSGPSCRTRGSPAEHSSATRSTPDSRRARPASSCCTARCAGSA